jgi:F-type H+-transporting ATPase subunit b
MAMGIAGKVIGREINEADHKNLVDDFIKNVGDTV